MALPGFLNDVAPEQVDQWHTIVEELIGKSVQSAQNSYRTRGFDLPVQVVPDGDTDLSDTRLVQDWPGFPQRYENALGRGRTESFLRHCSDAGLQGRLGQEEYIEWRDVCDPDGKLLRVEMTTETQEYWCFLASVDPNQTLQLLADFARVQTIDPRDVYGAHDPFSNTSTPALRFAAFRARMARPAYDQPVPSRYNNGVLAIAFMANAANSLAAAINLTAFGGYPFGTPDHARALTGDELTATLPFQAATPCRNSDPLIYGTATRSAWEGRKLALADPAGLYIKHVGQGGALLMPDNKTAIPETWYKLSRGCTVYSDGEDISLFQRLVVEPDPKSGLVLGDLIVSDTGRRVRSGADIARMVTVALHLKTSRKNISSDYKQVGIMPAASEICEGPESKAYADVHRVYAKWLEDQRVQGLSLCAEPLRGA